MRRYALLVAVAVSRARNIQKQVTFDRERYDAVEEMARGMGVSFSAAVHRLVDLQAGKVLAALEAVAEPEPFEVGRWTSRRISRALIADVAGAVRQGRTRADAYRAVEVSPKQGERWERKGMRDMENETPSIHADLVAAVERARSEFNGELLGEFRASGAPEKILKMLDPDQFVPVARSEVDVTHRYNLVVDWEKGTLEQAKQLAYLLKVFSPEDGSPSLSKRDRPAIEAVPADVLELVEEGEWSEAPSLEARALGEQKPDH